MINCSKLIYVLVAKKFQIFRNNNFDIWLLLAASWLCWHRHCVSLTVVRWLYWRCNACKYYQTQLVNIFRVWIHCACIQEFRTSRHGRRPAFVGERLLLWMECNLQNDHFSTLSHLLLKQCDQFHRRWSILSPPPPPSPLPPPRVHHIWWHIKETKTSDQSQYIVVERMPLCTYYRNQVEITASICVLFCVHVFRFFAKNLWTKRLLAAVLSSKNRILCESERELCVCAVVSLFRVDTKVYSLLGHIFRLMCAPASVPKRHQQKNTDNRKQLNAHTGFM